MLPSSLPKKTLFSFLFIATTLSLTATPTVSPNNIYSSAGIVTFDTSPYYNTGNNILNPFAITISFGGRIQPNTNYRFGYAIQDINYEIIGNKLNYSLQLTSKATTSAVINYYTNNADKINLLKIGYLIIQPLFGVYYFSFRWLKPQLNFHQPLSPFTQSSTSQGPFTGTTYSTWATILGVDANLAANNDIDLYPTITVTSTTSISYQIATILTTPFYLNSILIEAFVYDSTQLQGFNRNALITVGTLGNTFTGGMTATDSTNSVRNYNTLFGMIGFHIVSIAYLQFTTTITPNNALSFSSTYTFNYVNFNYMIANFAYCAPATPYLLVSSRLCYDLCPIRYSTDTFYFQCKSCPTYDCYYCGTNGLCTQCSSAVDFRKMDTTTNRCVPLDGYFDDGTNSQAVACDLNACLTCTSLTSCLSCQTGKYLISSACVNCILNCLNCANGASCSQCNTGYVYYAANNSCILDCSAISNCLTCNYSPSINCDSCLNGYQLASNTCNSVCADGLILATQGCDDGNMENGDGCSNDCQTQPSFSCTANSSGTSVCSLTSLAIEFQSATKDEFSNSLTLLYKITPNTVNALKTLDWSAITSQASNLSLNFSQFSYDASTGNLKINVHYQQILSERQLALQFAFPNSTPFNQLGNKSNTVTLSASNSLSLQFYEAEEYQAAYILKFIALGLTILSLFLFFLGYYSGKLIAIQLIAIFQLTYFSLLSVQNLSPGFVALKSLRYSNLYNAILFGESSKVSDTHFSFLNYDLNFLNDFNIAFFLVIIPLSISLILFIVNKIKYSSQDRKLNKYSRILKGQITFYGLLFGSYSIFVAFFEITKQIKYLQIQQTIFFTIACALILLLLIYVFLLIKYSHIFGQFADQIAPIFCGARFYLLIGIQKLLTAVLLVFLKPKLNLFIVIALLLTLLIIIAIKKPYIYSGRNVSPILNLTISITIELLIVFSSILQSKLHNLSTYAPFVIAGLLLIALAYNVFFFVKQAKRQKVLLEKQENKNLQVLMSTQREKIKDFTSLLLAKKNGSILESSKIRQEFEKEENKEFNNAFLEIKYHLGRIKGEEAYFKPQAETARQNNLATVELKPNQFPIL